MTGNLTATPTKANIRVQITGETPDGVLKKIARLCGSKLFFEESHSTIWITWLETPPRERNRGQAKTLIEFLKATGKHLSPGSFSPSAKPLKKYFEPET